MYIRAILLFHRWLAVEGTPGHNRLRKTRPIEPACIIVDLDRRPRFKIYINLDVSVLAVRTHSTYRSSSHLQIIATLRKPSAIQKIHRPGRRDFHLVLNVQVQEHMEERDE